MHLCRALVITFEGENLRLHSANGEDVRLSARFAWLLAEASTGTSREDLLQVMETSVGRVQVSHILRVLQAADILHVDQDCTWCPRRRRWRPWSPEGELFHFGTRNVPYSPVTEESAAQIASAAPRPELFKSYPGAENVSLPPVDTDEAILSHILLRRRTSRVFANTRITQAMLSNILGMTWGVWGYKESQYKGQSLLKTSPSAGGQHPIETYLLLSGAVDAIPMGVYHYSAVDHCLEEIHVGEFRPSLGEIFVSQPFVPDIPALFVMTGVFERAMWKYPFSRAYRTLLLDAGHLGQTFCVMAESMGLRSFCTAAFHDGNLEELLGLDPIDEGALYVLGAGSATA